ncbi:ubiquinol-cytochrome c reductase complex assembly factor 4-like [Branchiostoma lanceolatum]|uniref:ubiquinol-cytochrome c reductase complex assembly factor 4-like n=1 Tax=Branchiostoma lanceolatum TaxID=7740 RepID=UPI003454562A
MAGRLLTSQICIITGNRGASRLFQRLLHTKLLPKCQSLSTSAARCARKTEEPPVEEDPGPVKFTTSKGAQWRVAQTMNLNRHRPVRKIVPVSLTLTAILLYFCVFRKETWLDDELDKNLYARMPGLLPSDEDTDSVAISEGQDVATTNTPST